jgi:hypothetical protein
VSQTGEIIPFESPADRDSFVDNRRRLTDILVRYCLIDSLDRFNKHGTPYPFIEPANLLPNTATPSIEQPYQNTVLVFMLDGGLPRGLNKHFRLRGSNRVTWRNIQRLAPGIGAGDYKSAHCELQAPQAEQLLRKLSKLDYALMIERNDDTFALTHMHVKVERLTDNAIKDLGKTLGYIDRRLFERGEDYVDALEAKFFEYYGFSQNASGRKGAAAMAAQLLAGHDERFAVFVSSQEDCRLSQLDDSDLVTQYLLARLDDAESGALAAVLEKSTGLTLADYTVGTCSHSMLPVVLFRVRFRRREPAQGMTGDTGPDTIDRSLTEPWLDIADQAVLAPPGSDLPPLPFLWFRGEV